MTGEDARRSADLLLADTRPHVRGVSFRLNPQFFRGRGRPRYKCISGQGTGDHGWAYALEDSNLTALMGCLPEKYPWPITTGPE
jgi:hypothetical protein